MRNLSDWDGKRVRYRGYVDRWEVDEDYDQPYAVLLKNVRVKLYEGSKERRFDHLWVYIEELPPTEDFTMERLIEVDLVGDVHPYTRSTGTADYGIENVPGVEVFGWLQEMDDVSTEIKLEAITKAIEICDNGKAHLEWDIEVPEFRERLARRRRGLERELKAEKAQKRHPVSKDPKISGRKLGKAAGFGK